MSFSTVPGHPKFTKAALFDIISPDLRYGPLAAGAEIISVVNDCLDTFPNLSQNYDIHISHSKSTLCLRFSGSTLLIDIPFYLVIEMALNRVPAESRATVADTLNQPKSSIMQKRALLLKKGLGRSTADELEILSDVGEYF